MDRREPGSEHPNSPVASTTPRGIHLTPWAILVVALGGIVGTGVRYTVERAFPAVAGHWPVATFAINLAGAFVLGVLLEALTRAGPDDGRRRVMRLGFGTGALGAFTTYSTLAVETTNLIRGGAVPLALAYLGASVVLGAGAAAAGIALSSAWSRTHSREGSR